MRELFLENGHLTQDALYALVNEEDLSELERLEIAEHLSFCDECILNYAIVCNTIDFIETPEIMTISIMKKIKNRAKVIFINKYTTFAAAACFALFFWSNGVFNVYDKVVDNENLHILVEQSNKITQGSVTMTETVSEGIERIMNKINNGGIFENEKK